jgi:hypothetical protein
MFLALRSKTFYFYAALFKTCLIVLPTLSTWVPRKKETGLQKSRKITISCRRVQNFLRCGTKPSVGSTKKNKTKTHTSLKPQIKGKAESHLTPSLICQAGSLPVVN